MVPCQRWPPRARHISRASTPSRLLGIRADEARCARPDAADRARSRRDFLHVYAAGREPLLRDGYNSDGSDGDQDEAGRLHDAAGRTPGSRATSPAFGGRERDLDPGLSASASIRSVVCTATSVARSSRRFASERYCHPC